MNPTQATAQTFQKHHSVHAARLSPSSKQHQYDAVASTYTPAHSTPTHPTSPHNSIHATHHKSNNNRRINIKTNYPQHRIHPCRVRRVREKDDLK
jgi:hypothetical protein